MFRSYRIGTLFGFPIEVNLSFLILLGVFALWMGPLVGLAFVAIAFGSVLLHELGHALVARSLGVPIGGIELHFFGGAAKMMRMPKNANHEIGIAAAGPAVSFALGGIGALLYTTTGLPVFGLFMWINLILGAFNLVPALPMDGGRIFRALLTKKYSFYKSTEISVMVSRGFAVLLGLYGLLTMQIYLPLLAVVLWFMGTAELQMARHHDPYARDRRTHGNVEVMPPGFHPGAPRQRDERRRPGGKYVIVRRGGRMVIERVD